MHKIHIWIIILLSVLSITLGIMLLLMTIKYKKDTGDVPTEEFHNRDFSDKSYHINDFMNYVFGQCTYDKERGLLVREEIEGDFYFEPDIVFDNKEIKSVLVLKFFNYGEDYRILTSVKDDVIMSIVRVFVKEFRYSLLDKSSVRLKEKLHNNKYGDAGLTDIVLKSYNPLTGKVDNKMHSDVFVTPLALKYLQDASSMGCLVFFQFLKSGSSNFAPDVVVKEVIAVGDDMNTYLFNEHSDMIYSRYEIEEEDLKSYIEENF